MSHHDKHESKPAHKATTPAERAPKPSDPVPDVIATNVPNVADKPGPTKTIILSGTPTIVDSHVSYELPANEFGPRIKIGQQMYEHSTEDANGTWIFVPTK